MYTCVYARERKSNVADELSITCGDCVAGVTVQLSSFYGPTHSIEF